jgi:hypothetical protein
VTLDEARHVADIQGLTATSRAVVDMDCTRNVAATLERSDDFLTQSAITDAAEETLAALVGQIMRTLHFLETQRRPMHPTAIWLLGGGASLANIEAYLAQSLPLSVHSWRMAAEDAPIPCASGQRAALFGGAVALSALAWEAA